MGTQEHEEGNAAICSLNNKVTQNKDFSESLMLIPPHKYVNPYISR
jgi:hypothetical protein